MDNNLLVYKRKHAGSDTQFSASQALGKSQLWYRNRESGRTECSPGDIVEFVNLFKLTLDEVNAIFFDGKLPYGNTLGDEVI